MKKNIYICVCVCVCVCVCICAKLLQLCPTLCDSMDYSPPGSSVHGILQTRILEQTAMPSSYIYMCVCVCVCMCVYKTESLCCTYMKESESESHSVVSNSLRLLDSIVQGILQARILKQYIYCCMYIYMHVCVCIHTYIYIYI